MVDINHAYDELLEQLNRGACVLFLGAGSTRNCRKPNGSRGLTGEELANEILSNLNGKVDPGFKVSLTEASEYYATVKASARGGLDELVQKRLQQLQPTIGHHLATTFNWRAIITTNYNQVAEDAWGAASSDGYRASEILPMRTDADIQLHSGNTTHARFYKPHGCITIQKQIENRMVLTSLDYFESERIRPKMYAEIRKLAKDWTTLFIGYSMADYTFRNIFYNLYHDLGAWAVRSYSVGPVQPEKRFEWMARSMDKSFNTTLINDAFDTFMVRLALRRGHLHPVAKQRVLDNWTSMAADCGSYMTNIDQAAFKALPRA